MTNAFLPNHVQNSANNLRNEQQKVDLTGVTAGKTWTLTFDGATTSNIAAKASATAAEVQSKLEGLPNIDPGDVAVTGSTGGPFTVEFKGQYANTDVPTMTAAAAEGSAPVITTVQTASNGVQRGTGNADATGRTSPLAGQSPVEQRAAEPAAYGDDA